MEEPRPPAAQALSDITLSIVTSDDVNLGEIGEFSYALIGGTLTLARIASRQWFTPRLHLLCLDAPVEHEGCFYNWRIDYWTHDAENKPLSLFRQDYFQADTIELARKELKLMGDKLGVELAALAEERRAGFRPYMKMPAGEQDVHKARWKVLAQSWPVTAEAIETGSNIPRAYGIELSAMTGFICCSSDSGITLAEITNAARRTRARNVFDEELAIYWKTKGYEKMGSVELADAVCKATGQTISPRALWGRRNRLGLTSEVKPGPPRKF